MGIREWDEEPTGHGNEEAGWLQLAASRARPAGYRKMATQGSKRQKKKNRTETGTQNGRTCNSILAPACDQSLLATVFWRRKWLVFAHDKHRRRSTDDSPVSSPETID